MFKILITALFITSSLEAFAWGRNGHRIVGEIAQRNLNLNAKKAVEELLGKEDLARVSTWADEIKSDSKYNFISPWHYVNFPYDKSYFDQKISSKGDIIEALVRQDAILRDKKSSKEDRVQALKLIVHLVGDIHQPLHVGTEEDLGGNLTKLLWFGASSNLHELWDTHLIDFEEMSYTEYSTVLNHFTNEERKEIQKGHYLSWALETRSHKDVVYDLGDKNLGYVYHYKSKPVYEASLKRGGLRLAKVLNDIFSNVPYSKEYLDFTELVRKNY